MQTTGGLSALLLRLLQVRDELSGATYSGASPTAPWTDVCLAHRTGQRISGGRSLCIFHMCNSMDVTYAELPLLYQTAHFVLSGT